MCRNQTRNPSNREVYRWGSEVVEALRQKVYFFMNLSSENSLCRGEKEIERLGVNPTRKLQSVTFVKKVTPYLNPFLEPSP